MITLYSLAHLSDEQLQKVKAFEKETGKTILVFRDFETDAAMLSADQVKQLQGLEKDLGHVAIAVK